VLHTERLVLRDWRDTDLDVLAAINADPAVMEFYPRLMTRDDTAAMIARIRAKLASDGFGFWALETAGTLIGFCGISRVTFEAPFTPAVEIGWRLARSAWGHGYASEAARAALAFGWARGIDSIVAFLVCGNHRSAAVAQRIGMVRDPDGDFDHPSIGSGDRALGGQPNQRHVLYRSMRQVAPQVVIDAAKT
jgi:RimJ/RimL family protein N-acetyltransferase